MENLRNFSISFENNNYVELFPGIIFIYFFLGLDRQKSNYECPFNCAGKFDTKADILAHIEDAHMEKEKSGSGGKKSLVKSSTRPKPVSFNEDHYENQPSGSGYVRQTTSGMEFKLWNIYFQIISFFKNPNDN